MKKILSIFIIVFFDGGYAEPADSLKTFYVINYSWHTGFILKTDSGLDQKLTAAEEFKEYKYLDVGWGDEEFYQRPDINYYLAAKAILVPTSSAIRIAGYKFDLSTIELMSDYLVEFKTTEDKYLGLLDFIEEAFEKEGEETVLLSESSGGRIKFYASHKYYHLFNTCNTWIAKGLVRAGIKISKFKIVRSEDLFNEIKDKGRIIKPLRED